MKGQALWEVSVVTSPEAEEAVGELLERVFQQPASIYIDAETQATVATVYLASRAEWTASKRAALAAGLQQIERNGLPIRPGKISTKPLRREDWAESWKRHFKPIAIGTKLLIKPSWSQRQPRPAQALVVLDPGLSFGTGQHPTTRFCLQQLVSCRRRGRQQSFLDIGAGSGILAIASAKLGYSPVHGFDVDPEAVRVARRNAAANSVHTQVLLRRQDLTRLPRTSRRRYDVVCANLIGDLLVAESQRILNRLQPDGTLVLAGILASQFDPVRGHYESAGLKLKGTRIENEWQSVAFVGRA